MKYFKIIYKKGRKKYFDYIEAPNKIEAIKSFRESKKGILVDIKESSKPITYIFDDITSKFKNPIKNKKANLEKIIAIFDQLYIMLDAGIPLNTVLEEIYKNQDDLMLKAIFKTILDDIESGKSFYEAAYPFKRQLGYLTLSMIRLGEETGTLAESIKHLSNILQAILENRRKFKKATRYPMFILFAMIIAFIVVTVMVIPQFEAFFKQSQMELPLPTIFLLWLEHSIINYGPYILSFATLIFLIVLYFYRKNERVRLFLDKMVLKIYILGKATKYAMLSRFLYVFRVLIEAGIPMIEALNIASDIVENSYIKTELSKISKAIEEGRSLYQGFKDTNFFENMIVEMVKAGEIGGGLDKMINKVSKVYQDRFNYIVENIAVLIEPVLIAAIAGFVLTLALGIFLPMWNMVEVLG